MIFSKKDIQEVLPADVTGRSVAHPKRWLVALVRISHEKKTSERLSENRYGKLPSCSARSASME